MTTFVQLRNISSGYNFRAAALSADPGVRVLALAGERATTINALSERRDSAGRK
jgi:hypothetical protein